MLVSQETHGGYNGPVAGEILPVVRSRGPAFEAITLPILCPKFLGTEFAEGQCAVFLEHSVSQNLGHRICDTSLMLTPTVRSPLLVDGWGGEACQVCAFWEYVGRVRGVGCLGRVGKVGRHGVHCTPAGRPGESWVRTGRAA